jgi:hypothetical protein
MAAAKKTGPIVRQIRYLSTLLVLLYRAGNEEWERMHEEWIC